MVVRPDDPRPAYMQVADDIRHQIETGGLQPGQRLPSMRDLACIYEIAYMTAQNAVRALREQGLIVAHQGRGAFVIDDQQQLSEALERALFGCARIKVAMSSRPPKALARA